MMTGRPTSYMIINYSIPGPRSLRSPPPHLWYFGHHLVRLRQRFEARHDLTNFFLNIKLPNIFIQLIIDIKEGEIFALVGPNGAGKSTIFNLISRLYKQNEGNIFFDGKLLNQLKFSLEKRRQLCKKSNEMFCQILTVDDYDKELLQEFYRAMCVDINLDYYKYLTVQIKEK